MPREERVKGCKRGRRGKRMKGGDWMGEKTNTERERG